MRLANLLLCAGFVLSPVLALADGPETDYGAPGPYDGQPAYQNEEELYQAPESACYDEEDQQASCAGDAEYASYGQIDDGYDETAYQDFEGALSPYGSWVQSAQWGQVWVPSTSVVGFDFQPYYSGGHWVLTGYGWTWVSDYDWGWAPFHYGRWMNLTGYGWGWVPGRIWGPSWVHWRHGGGYVGWTPLPPRGVRIPPPAGARAGRWNFVPAPQLGAPRLARVAPSMVPGLFGRTAAGNVLRAIGATRVNIGPLPGTLSLQVNPAPLQGLQVALPRAHVSVRAGLPLTARPYLPSIYQRAGGVGVARPFAGRPAYQPPIYTAPTYGRPGWRQPTFQVNPRPTYQAPTAPMYQRPGFQPGAPVYQRPSFQAPSAPVYQRPSFQAPSAPVYQRPSFQAPSAPVYQRPSFQAPSAPVYQRPSFQAPSAPVYQRPSFQAPSAPVYQRPSFQAPSAPVYQRPSFQAPSAPVYQRPSFQAPSAPVYQRPSFQAPAPAPFRR